MKTILVVSLLSIVTLALGVCSPTTCGGTDRCCEDAVIGSVCYNPLTHSCRGQNPRRLCGINEDACGTICYNPSNAKCINGKLCGQNLDVCGSICYDPLHYQCANNQLVPRTVDITCSGVGCANDTLCCESLIGSSCYSPQQGTCCGAIGNTSFKTVCGKTPSGKNQICCGTFNAVNCYDPDVQYCCSERFGKLCNLGDYACCYG